VLQGLAGPRRDHWVSNCSTFGERKVSDKPRHALVRFEQSTPYHVGVAINVVLFNRWKLEAQREGWRTIDTSADLCTCPLLRIVCERRRS
jgi:hypothetical protein